MLMTGHAKRILDWFEKFSYSQRRERETGAQALVRFAFVNREKYWNELEWKRTHGQAPATLACKPHYFLDLDVLRTVENFLDYVPEFWSSDELWDSLKDGDLLALDTDFFVRKLLEKMEDESSHVYKMLEKVFWEDEFTYLCQRLLSFLDDCKMLQVVNDLSRGLAQASARQGRKKGENDSWLIKVLRFGAECPSLECVIICNACITHSRQLLHLLQDRENVEDSSLLNTLLLEVTNSTQQKHRAFWRDCLCWNKWELVKGLALESWAIQVLVSKGRKSTASLKALLSANSIQFRQPSLKKKSTARAEKKRKKRRRKKRTLHMSSDEEYSSKESDMDDAIDGFFDNTGCWYLSIDNFNLGMEKDEIPEQLANFAFMQWLNWKATKAVHIDFQQEISFLQHCRVRWFRGGSGQAVWRGL
ncbi:hypothetical protein L7F22_022668 [Adiantum nelumboides]|nr:hypothetical protein [Adiantum nelumboides]